MLQIPAFCAILGVPMNQSIISFVLINKRSLNCSEKKKLLGVPMNQSIISFVLINKRSLNCSEKKKLEEGSGKIEYS